MKTSPLGAPPTRWVGDSSVISSGYAVSSATSSPEQLVVLGVGQLRGVLRVIEDVCSLHCRSELLVAGRGRVDVERRRGVDECRIDGRELDGHRSESNALPVGRASDVSRPDVVRRRGAEQRQRDLELFAQDRQRALDSGLTARRERPEHRPADQHAARAEGPSDSEVEAAPDAAVDPDLGATVDRRDDLREDIDRGRDAIELAGAVIADDDAVDPVLGAKPRIVPGHDALDHQRERRPAADRGQVVPREPGEDRLLELREPVGVDATGMGRAAAGHQVAVRTDQVEARPSIAGPVAQHGQVDGHDDRPVAGCFGSLDELTGAGRVGLRVQLEPADAGRGARRDLLHRPGRHRREDVRDAGDRRRPSHGDLAVRMGEPLGRHRRDGQRHRRRLPEHGRGGVDPADVHEHARAQAAPAPGRLVLGQADLVPGAAGHVVERAGIHREPREGLEVGQRDDRRPCADRARPPP